ncbi:c-type cytochrome [Brevundimonas sp. FT23028]|uniref:c-type cytochrome n=1 Tax=Brevundimonas sp. FT23028 TaxID=3393748 RepID=UPI003B58AFEC
MKRTLILTAVGLMCLGGAANAQGAPEALVKARQAGMILSGNVVGGLKAAIDAGQAPASQRGAVRGLARWAHTLPELFPEGTDPDTVDTGARPAVWTDRDGFNAKAAEFSAAVDRLSELSQGEDAAAFSAQWGVVRAGCQSCHDVYKD